MLTQQAEHLTPRESILLQNETEREEKQINFSVRIREMELEAQRMDAKWSALLRIPTMIIKLPVMMLMAVAYIVHAAVKKDPPEIFWKFFK